MATFLDDAMVGDGGGNTNLSAHTTGVTGGPYTYGPANTNTLLVQASTGRLRVSAAAGAQIGSAYAAGTPSTADYDVIGVFVYSTAITGYMAVTARTSTSADTAIIGGFRSTSGSQQWEIREAVTGTEGLLGTPYAQALTVGQLYTMKLEVRGSTVNLYVDSVLRATATTSISAAGKAGVRTSGGITAAAAGVQLDSIQAIDAPVTYDARRASGFFQLF